MSQQCDDLIRKLNNAKNTLEMLVLIEHQPASILREMISRINEINQDYVLSNPHPSRTALN